MPWWLWLLLTVFLLSTLIGGIVFALWRFISALNTVAQVGSRLLSPLERLADSNERESAQKPLLTQPLIVAVRRYEHTRQRVEVRAAQRRSRHKATWWRWRQTSLRTNDVPPLFQ